MRYLTLCLLPFLWLSCQQEEETAEIDYTIIKGSILNVEEPSMLFASTADYRMLEVAEDGSFADTIYMDLARTVSMRMGEPGLFLYLEKGDVIDIAYDGEKGIDEIVITGDEPAITKFLNRDIGTDGEGSRDKFNKTYSQSEEDFIVYNDSIKSAKLAEIESTELPEDFRAYAKRGEEFGNASRLKNYPVYYGYATGNDTFEVSEAFLSKIPSFDMDDDALAQQHVDYQWIVLEEMDETLDGLEDTTMTDIQKRIAVMKQKQSPTIQALWMEQGLQMLSPGTPDLANAKAEILAAVKNPHVLRNYIEKFTKLEKLMPGQPSPSFNMVNHAGGKTSLEELKGQVVYIDVWATWCGPCIQEIPSLQEVEKEFHDKNVAFVSISIDDLEDEEKWRTFVDERELGGIQLMGEKAWSSAFALEYEINSIPRFILLDSEGKIISADAPRPSEDKLKEQLASLLAK